MSDLNITIRSFKISKWKLLFKSLFNLLLLLILLIIIFVTIEALSGFFRNDKSKGFIGVGYLLLSVYALLYFGTFFKLFFQYYIHDKNNEIYIDYALHKIIIKDIKSGKEKIFDDQNLKSLEFNISTKSTQNLTSEYDFVKLKLIDNEEYIITNLILDSSHLIDVLPNVKRLIKLNSINYLNK